VREIFIPTFELVMWHRDHKGQPVNKRSRYVATKGSTLRGHYEAHRRRFPLPKGARRDD
jgi:hypothetical protein